mmetsp:Transcript_40163/g.125319  ORF Transcript_40163/g.125319 Transcript_40163/m.125319 type:complete len:228 (-) Transcript_40163:400-1083(-)
MACVCGHLRSRGSVGGLHGLHLRGRLLARLQVLGVLRLGQGLQHEVVLVILHLRRPHVLGLVIVLLRVGASHLATHQGEERARPDGERHPEGEHHADDQAHDEVGVDLTLLGERGRQEEPRGDGHRERCHVFQKSHREHRHGVARRLRRAVVPPQEQVLVDPVLHEDAASAHQGDPRQHGHVAEATDGRLQRQRVAPRLVHGRGRVGLLELLDVRAHLLLGFNLLWR